MNFLKKIFKSNKQPQSSPQKKKSKPSFITWLCASKSQNQYEQPVQRGMQTFSQQYSGKKSTISQSQTNNTKIVQRLSFSHDKSQYAEQQIRSMLITVTEQRMEKIQDIIIPGGMYAMINSQQPLLDVQSQCIWLKIGKHEQINSLSHIKPYIFDRIFMIFDQFGSQYSIEQILKSKQNILLKISSHRNIQSIIQAYEKQLIKHFAFKIIADCFYKLKITIIRTKNRQTWLSLNQQTQSDTFVDQILRQIGFDQYSQEYQSLKQQIPTGLTLQQYIDIIEHKQKLQSKYQGQSVGEYIKNKFLQKISKKGKSPRNDSPRSVQKNQKSKNQYEYEEYILSVTANTLPKDNIQYSQRYEKQDISKKQKKRGHKQQKQKQSYEQQIFDFNVYKDEKQQQAKRVAINRQRKKRSKSQDIFINDLDNAYQYGDEFDQKE